MKTVERWKDVVEYEGLYQVSNLGRVRSLDRLATGRRANRFITGKILSLCFDKDGYPKVRLYKDSNATSFFVHRLVLETFVGPCPLGMESRHYPSNNPSDCKLSNLSWSTGTINKRDKVEHGTDNLGIRNGRSKLTNEDVLDIRKLHADGVSIKEITSMYNVGRSHARRIIIRECWHHI